jgi:DNA-binding IclR family transcriptional regulator
MAQHSDGPKTVRAVENSFAVLETLKASQGLTLSQLARELDIAKSTTHRYLKTLEHQRYVVRENGRYHVGLRFLSLGTRSRNRQEAYDLIKPKIEKLAAETGEVVHYMVEEYMDAVSIHRELGENAVRTPLETGDRVPVHSIAAGKAIMAEWSDNDIERYLEEKELEERTDNTITDAKTLRREIAEIRESGVAFNREEYAEELMAVGAALVNPVGDVVGSISIEGPTHRLEGERIQTELPELLAGTTHEIELNIKYAD